MRRVQHCAKLTAQPTTHFMCKHSFHARCLGDNDAECPNCARSHGLVREVLRSNAQFADRHDLFVQECVGAISLLCADACRVEESDDGWSTISQAFSRGLMGLSRAEPA